MRITAAAPRFCGAPDPDNKDRELVKILLGSIATGNIPLPAAILSLYYRTQPDPYESNHDFKKTFDACADLPERVILLNAQRCADAKELLKHPERLTAAAQQILALARETTPTDAPDELERSQQNFESSCKMAVLQAVSGIPKETAQVAFIRQQLVRVLTEEAQASSSRTFNA